MSTELARKLRRDSTLPERRIWGILRSFRNAGWHFRREVELGPYYVDFACITAKVAIEVDGETHASDDAIAADVERDAYLAERGFLVLRFWNDDVTDSPDGVWERISSVLESISATKSTPTLSLPAGGREALRPRRSGSEVAQ